MKQQLINIDVELDIALTTTMLLVNRLLSCEKCFMFGGVAQLVPINCSEDKLSNASTNIGRETV